MVPMDPLLIEQVIMNLLENAVIHSESKQAVDLVVTDSSDSVTFHVIDYGKGLDEDKIPSLFEGQSASGSSDSHKGMGIGLSICKTIIQAHNGTICAFNHENGAEFSFTLPKEGIHDPKFSVLIIEDETHILNFMRKILTSHDYKVLSAIPAKQDSRSSLPNVRISSF